MRREITRNDSLSLSNYHTKTKCKGSLAKAMSCSILEPRHWLSKCSFEIRSDARSLERSL